MSIQQGTDDTRTESIRIGPDDPRYLAVVNKRFNKRFTASPDYVRLVSSTDQVVSAVEDAGREGQRLVVTGGGDWLEGFVLGLRGGGVFPLSPRNRTSYDTRMAALGREAGAAN